jgi:hypothetical protein
MYQPPPLLQILSLSSIQETVVPQAQVRHTYTEDETCLFNYLLESPKEKQHIKPQKTSIDWEAFAKRWAYYYRVEKCQGNSTYYIELKPN